MKPTVAIVCAGLLVTAPLAPAVGQSEQGGAPFSATTLSLPAYGEVSVPPDEATMDVGVETAAPTAVEASRANATQMGRVVAALRGSGVADRDMQTAQLSLSPQYAYESGHSPRLTGYQASNRLSVVIHDLSNLGRVADFATGAGATNLGQISFGLENPTAAENSARVAAVKSLEDKAALYAQATGYRINRLVSLSEGEGPRLFAPAPLYLSAAKQNIAAPTPVEEGRIKVRVDVIGLFELAK